MGNMRTSKRLFSWIAMAVRLCRNVTDVSAAPLFVQIRGAGM